MKRHGKPARTADKIELPLPSASALKEMKAAPNGSEDLAAIAQINSISIFIGER